MVSTCTAWAEEVGREVCDVRFGSKADMCGATSHVRFTPNSDRESGFPANGHVRFTLESGHVQCNSSCLLWASSRHRFHLRPPMLASRPHPSQPRNFGSTAYRFGGGDADN